MFVGAPPEIDQIGRRQHAEEGTALRQREPELDRVRRHAATSLVTSRGGRRSISGNMPATPHTLPRRRTTMTSAPTAAAPRFGLSLPNRAVLFGLPAQALLDAAEQAEASGVFDSVWVGDNYLSKPRLESIVTLSAIAARTERVRLGVVCLASFPLRDPLLLALQWASLDIVSRGRTILAVCLGGKRQWGGQFAAEMIATGIEDKERIPRLEEGIKVLRKLWGPDEVVSFDGRFTKLESVRFPLKPAQAEVPIVIATNPKDPQTQESAFRRIARLANGWQIDVCAPDEFRQKWEQIRGYAAEYGRADEVYDSSIHIMCNINDDEAAARQESVEFLNKYYGAGILTPDRLGTWLAVGSPKTVIARLAEYVRAGVTTPILRFTSVDQKGQIARCAKEVLPALRDAAVPV
jgi:alkanesulfonate monooxygenase SsuD/methylene tetrahydromethanopterin reductase-like flavin-dependent oxidoreductase (luciferase family)